MKRKKNKNLTEKHNSVENESFKKSYALETNNNQLRKVTLNLKETAGRENCIQKKFKNLSLR